MIRLTINGKSHNIDVEPEVRCRVMTTTTLESYTIGHTIVLSRGIVDVLPDEASLGAILAHELSHVVLGHRLDFLRFWQGRADLAVLKEALDEILPHRVAVFGVPAQLPAEDLVTGHFKLRRLCGLLVVGCGLEVVCRALDNKPPTQHLQPTTNNQRY